MKRKKQTLITTVLLVCIVFIVGVIVGNSWKTQSSSEISKVLRSSELDAESFLIEQELFAQFETNCDFAKKRVDFLSQELWRLGKLLGRQDAKSHLGEDDYRFLKRKYHLMQIRTFVIEKKLQDECKSDTATVLFYFGKDDGSSEEQGKILDELVEELDLHVFAVEYNYSKELRFLEEYYGIESTPALVLNFTKPIKGVVSAEEIAEQVNG